MDVIENFAKGQIGYFFVESMFWETLPMINYGSGMFSGTKLGDKVNRVSGDLLNKYYSTPASTSVEIISRNNKNITSKIDLDGSDSTEYVDLTGFRRTHILNNHKYGIGKPNKTEFPKNWSDDKIIHYVSDVDTDPNATWGVGKWNSPYAIGIREGVEIRVDFYPDVHKNYSGMISTAYPLNTPTNPPKGGVFNGN
ncbi:MAG: EndoU domain-containing protein [Synergistaceae bacterium]|nr:EndoU domain-containing protein [Synergistaceae bacterium]